MIEQEAATPLDQMGAGDMGAALAAASDSAAMGAMGGAPAEETGGGGAAGAQGTGQPQTKKPWQGQVQSLDFILDIPLQVTVELGRSKMAIRDILQLGQGSVIELSKFAGEPLEVLVNDKLVARGEVVVVNEKFGIRLTDIISPIERIEQLK